MQIPIEHRQRDEAREPEQHSQRIEGEDGDAGSEGGKEFGREAKVEDHEEGPERDENEEGVLRGGAGVAGNWRE